jgi:hypothetical protein
MKSLNVFIALTLLVSSQAFSAYPINISCNGKTIKGQIVNATGSILVGTTAGTKNPIDQASGKLTLVVKENKKAIFKLSADFRGILEKGVLTISLPDQDTPTLFSYTISSKTAQLQMADATGAEKQEDIENYDVSEMTCK